jgi:hypothetical protein
MKSLLSVSYHPLQGKGRNYYQTRRKQMKFAIVMFLLCGLLLHATIATAEPVLVAVDMNGLDQIRMWRTLGYPTYEFIRMTAIAEIDDADIVTLTERGFSIQVIDVSPWVENYFIGSVQQADIELPGQIILTRNNARIVKSATARISDFMDVGLDFRPLRKQILSERFWDNITAKKVPLHRLEYDPFIQGLVNQVRIDSLSSYVQRLQNFQTRLLFSDSGFAATEWIRQKFNSFGYGSEFDSFYVDHTNYGVWPDTGYERNVIARIQGTVNPSRIFIVSGHHDAIIWPDSQSSWIFAPGADDNASAVAALLEAARIFHNYTWETSMEFITWAGEEVGLLGSDDYAHRADSLDLDIGGVVWVTQL